MLNPYFQKKKKKMFSIFSRSVAAFVASVSGGGGGGANNSTAQQEGHSSDDVQSVKSGGNNRRTSSIKSMSRQQKYEIERGTNNVDEIVQYLLEHFVPNEPILASLSIDRIDELTKLLSDLVTDAVNCSSTCIVRCPQTQQIDGVLLACKASLFDMQIDRLCGYEFENERVATACEFLKYVFNRLDITYHFEENKIFNPIFIAVVSVRHDKWEKGVASAMLDASILAAKTDKCDGAITLASNSRACRLISKRFPITIQSIRYDTFRGQHRNPPIVMPKDESQRALYVMLSRF